MYIMCGNIRTVEFNSEFEYEILNENLAPIYILNTGNIRRWIEERAADGARANIRAVKGYQRILRQTISASVYAMLCVKTLTGIQKTTDCLQTAGQVR